ncbi:MAG: VOC family protein [Fusobacteriaceae bacterium]|jgi:lactoylglutathione lyase/methylmalonyl-CoA/ethylmalonyl-CoA epimerase|nr:VOC family protein [Fusobacteriaceae bacterium]
MKPMRMHHVGIVLPTLEQAYTYIERMGLEVDYTGFVNAYHADIIFTKPSESSSPLEFIIPHEGVLTKFNGGKGGIAHVAFEVEDVEAVREEFESKGMQMLEEHAVVGIEDVIIVNFLRPKFSDGILTEFVQTIGPVKRD